MATYWDCSNVQWDCCRQKLCILFPRMVVSRLFPALWGNFLTEDDLGHRYLSHQHQRELRNAKKQTKITIKINNIQTVKNYFLDSFFIARLFLLLQITIWEQLSSWQGVNHNINEKLDSGKNHVRVHACLRVCAQSGKTCICKRITLLYEGSLEKLQSHLNWPVCLKSAVFSVWKQKSWTAQRFGTKNNPKSHKTTT